jgi:hypothetical protein
MPAKKQLTTLLLCFLITFACEKSSQIPKHLKYLASDELGGRFPVSVGDSLASGYISGIFTRFDLKPLNHRYFQDFPFLTDIEIQNAAMTVHSPSKKINLAWKKDFVLRPGCVSSNISAGVAFIGYGIYAPEAGYNDFENVKDKMALCYQTVHKNAGENVKKIRKLDFKSGTRKAELVRRFGGKGIVFVDNFTQNQLQEIDLRKPLSQVSNREAGIPVLQISREVFIKMLTQSQVDPEKLDEKLRHRSTSSAFKIPGLTFEITTEVAYTYQPAHNILGLLPGKDTTQTLVIGAHYDHIGIGKPVGTDSIRNGADDNASGVALLLELVRLCAEQPEPFDCNLLFIAFGAEEWMMIGSHYFTQHIPPVVGKIKAMINFDMVGRLRDNRLFINQTFTAAEWKPLLAQIRVADLEITSNNRLQGSDSDVFIQSKIPAIFINTGTHPDIHKVTDEADRINFAGMEKILKYTFELVKSASRKEVTFVFDRAQRGE